MRILSAFLLLLVVTALTFAQNEQSPIVEKSFAYKNWTLKNLNAGGETNLREFTKGKKLVIVVYWAPWCPNWKHDVAFVQALHEKYKAAGLGVIGVGEYDPVDKMKGFIDQYKVTFPSVYESESTGARLTTVHYAQRTVAGDTRKWGSPWYVFLDPATLEPAGEFLTKKTTVVNGELIQPDADKYIRERLGLSVGSGAIAGKANEIEACERDAKKSPLVKP